MTIQAVESAGLATGVEAPEMLRYQRPELPRLEDIGRYYALSEEERFYSNGGPCHERLAKRLSGYVGGNVSCIPVASCTAGLMVALRELCGEPGPERNLIAVPSFSFTATACAIRWAGFAPLFVDIDPDSWQLDPTSLTAALEQHSGRVAGVLGCSTFGSAPPAAVRLGWRAACARHELPLLIDSAAGFGACDADGRRLGGHGDTEVFSFHATKPFAIGEGGVIVTADPTAAERMERMINFGIDPDSKTSVVAGLNAKMPELMAAAGLAMLDHFDDWLNRRRATAEQMRERLRGCPVSYQSRSRSSTWQVFQLLMPDAITRNRAVKLAERLRIEVRTCFDPPLHRHPAFAAAGPELPVTDEIASRSLSLPMANSLGPSQMERLTELVERALGEGGC
jgi:dTDP-4-amino-4,6-dideoxygalactose transaminase